MNLVYFLLEKAIGIRAGLGSERELSRFQIRRHLRRPQNWLLPGVLGVTMMVGNFYLLAWTGEFLGYMTARILIMDYVVFAIGGLGALVAALRWRSDEILLQDLILTGVRPASIAHMMLAGPLSLWAAVLLMVAVAECLMVCLSLLKSNPLYPPFVMLIILLSLFPVNLFHLRSLGLVHSIFLIVSLRQVPLRQHAIRNLFLMVGIVTFLTIAGIAITIFLPSSGSIYYSLWITGIGKVFICHRYQDRFTRAFLCFVWYGAAEKVHPTVYPRHFSAPLARWMKYLSEEEIRSDGASPMEQVKPDIPSTTLL